MGLRLSPDAQARFVAIAAEAGLDADLAAAAAQQVRLHDRFAGRALWHRWILPFAAPRGVIGITLGTDVYFDRAARLDDWPLLVHETTHVVQYLRRGNLGFLVVYGAQYLWGRARGLSDRDAYLALPDEVEARAVEARAVGRPAPRPVTLP